MGSVIGWDVGGAHLKAARAEDGRIRAVVQLPCPLWLGLDKLKDSLMAVLARLGPADWHVATMTGELADIFADRHEGVARIAGMLSDATGGSRLLLYGGRAGMLPVSAARSHADDIASANWHASAALAGRFQAETLFVDIGSTTTDIIPILSSRPCSRGYTDAERLATGELVYTGLTRTPVMAMARRAPVAGEWVTLATELFATSADIYRILGELMEEADQMPSADGREKTVPASRARLARMVGRDAADADPMTWRNLAAWFAEVQLRQIMDGAMLALSRAALGSEAPVIAAGIGEHVGGRLAARLNRPSRSFAELLNGLLPEDARDSARFSQCAPAVAVALLLAQDGVAA
jgi:probable H4MPT-linked C1 transfer pathway protein